MKNLNEHERILTFFGGVLIILAVTLSLATEMNARRYLTEYRKQVEAGSVIQQGSPAVAFKHVGYEQQTLASRWSFPDGHGTLGAGFAVFGVLLVAAPRAAAKKRQTAG